MIHANIFDKYLQFSAFFTHFDTIPSIFLHYNPFPTPYQRLISGG